MADEDEKWNAYHATILEFLVEPPLRVDLRRPLPADLAERLTVVGLAPPVAIFTAENPRGEHADDAPTAAEERREERRNHGRTLGLIEGLEELALHWVRVDGVAPDGGYRERCVAVTMGPEAAGALARRLEQLAYFWWDGTKIWLRPGTADHAQEPLPAATVTR